MTTQNAALDLSRCVPDRLLLRRLATILVASALMLGVVGPFGTHVVMSFGPRIAYWLATVGAIGGPIGLSLWALRRHVFRAGLPWWAPVAVAVLAAVPGTLVVELALSTWAPMALQHVSRPELAGQTLILNLIAVALERVLRRALTAPVAHEAPGEAAPPPAPVAAPLFAAPLFAAPLFADRLPPALAEARLLALQAEDHYLRFHTTAGQALIHMRLSEAVARLVPAEGLRVHRSYWVARAAVLGAERRDGRLMLRLRGGLAVPVSRSCRPELAQAGWLTTPHEPVKKSESA